MFKTGQKVVVRKRGEEEVGIVEDIVATEDSDNPLQVKVRLLDKGVSQVIPSHNLVEHLED